MRKLRQDEILKVGDVIHRKDGSTFTVYGLEGDKVSDVVDGNHLVCVERDVIQDTPDTPQISYHGATTVVRWPDGKINSAKPCQAQPEKKIKADTFDPTIGFLHCIAKRYVPDYKKIIENATGAG